MTRKEQRNIHQRAALLQAVVNSVVQNPSVTLTSRHSRRVRARDVTVVLAVSTDTSLCCCRPRSVRLVDCRELRP
jgi:hypothetical protein